MTGGTPVNGVWGPRSPAGSRGRALGLAFAKLNLTLHVTGRRPDGYHLLDSLVVFAGAHDTLTAEPAASITLELTGPFGATLSAEPDNLVLRAARALAAQVDTPGGARLILQKSLPIASGIGGGSADAAAALRLLCDLWNAPPTVRSALPALALSLGADVPVCLASEPARMRGIGDHLSPATLPPFGLVLVNPGISVATAAVFRALHQQRGDAFSPPLEIPSFTGASDLATWLRTTTNDLQPPAQSICPAIADVLHALAATPCYLLARMSGSGATCFALYETPAAAQHAAASINRPDWWCWAGAPA